MNQPAYSPTIFTPWYVVVRIDPAGMVSYYRDYEPGKSTMTHNKQEALIMTDLRASARVAAAEGGWVRVLTTADEGKEFTP